MKRVLVVGCVLALLLMALEVRADTSAFDITIPNAALSGYAAPYVHVEVTTLTSSTATVTATGFAGYLMGDGGSFDLNTNGAATAAGFNWSGGNAGTAFSQGSGNVSSFGYFNLALTNFDGYNSAVSLLSFTLTKDSGMWANAADVLTPNADGYIGAAHIFVQGPVGAGALVTGFAANGPSNVPEPATMLLLGFGILGLAGVRRFKR